MFNWLCPVCGRECLPSESECPACVERAKKAAQPAQTAQPVAPAATPVAGPAQTAPPRAAPRRHSAIPGWLTALVVAGVLGGGGWAGLRYVSSSRAQSPAATPLDEPRAQPASVGVTHPLARHVEITGLRFGEDARKKPQVRAMVVNHSGADIADLALNVVVRAATAAPGAEPAATFAVKLGTLGPYEAREIAVPVQTRLRAYELPDWQFIRCELTITSPPAK